MFHCIVDEILNDGEHTAAVRREVEGRFRAGPYDAIVEIGEAFFSQLVVEFPQIEFGCFGMSARLSHAI